MVGKDDEEEEVWLVELEEGEDIKLAMTRNEKVGMKLIKIYEVEEQLVK